MQSALKRVEQAISELKSGKMIILTDDADRENEGDLVFPAEMITPDIMNFMIREGSGIVCLALTSTQLQKLNLPLMVPAHENTSCMNTPFTISIDAKNMRDISGVSAFDRTKTVQLAIDDHVKPEDLVKPGHIFPLQAKDGGVLERQGHTEGSLDIVRFAGFKPAAVICEIMNPDGTMARGEKLLKFAEKHAIFILSIEDLITYRLHHENLIADKSSAQLPLDNYGEWQMTVVKEKYTQHEHIILQKEIKNNDQPTLVRIHSSCTTGDLFASKRCDCNDELHHSLKQISTEGGVLIYLNQEGRGIGLFNKIKAYALQEQGFDTVEANQQLGLPIDSRRYFIAANILRNLGIDHVRLLTNNPDKINDLQKYGVRVDREPMPIFQNEHNWQYLMTKMEKLNHRIQLS